MARKNFAGLSENLAGALGGIAGLLPPGIIGGGSLGQRQSVIQMARQCGKTGFVEQMMEAMRQQRQDILAFQLQAMRAPVVIGVDFARGARRPKRPWAVWQFRNGKTAPMAGPLDLPRPESGIEWFMAYDRSLGCDVVYAAR
jgi:hypothetical protein